MSKVQCIIPSCKNVHRKTKQDSKYNAPHISYHRFPKNNKLLYEQWLKKCGIKENISTRVSTANARVCSVHFVEGDFEVIPKAKRNKLKTTAIPSLHLPPQVSTLRTSNSVETREYKYQLKTTAIPSLCLPPEVSTLTKSVQTCEHNYQSFVNLEQKYMEVLKENSSLIEQNKQNTKVIAEQKQKIKLLEDKLLHSDHTSS